MFDHEALRRISTAQTALQVGIAGEHLVCADIYLNGYVAHMAAAGSTYDVIAEVGTSLLKIQVKSTVFQSPLERRRGTDGVDGYQWYPRRRGKGGSKRLDDDAVDAIALVALDVPVIAYLQPEFVGQTVQMSPPGRVFDRVWKGTARRGVDNFPFSRLVEDLGL